jgi:hypothetical protein
MYIILDTNIIIKDYFFSTPKFKALFSYLAKTPHQLILPQIVLDELTCNFSQELEHLNLDIEKINLKSKTSLDPGLDLKLIDIEAENKRYQDFLRNFVSSHPVLVVDYNSKHYKNIVSRSLFRHAPFQKNAKDHGFKDAIIWESVKDMVADSHYEFIAFVSNNTTQFTNNTEKNQLHTDLMKEIEKYKDKFLFFSNLESFLENYGQRLESISIDMLQLNLDNEIQKIKAEGHFSEDLLTDIFEERFSRPVYNIELGEVRLSHFYVSKADKTHYYVQAIGIATADIVYWDPLDSDFLNDHEFTGFDVSFKISKSNSEIMLDRFALDKVDNKPPF